MFKKILGLVLLVALLGCAPAEQKADDCMGVNIQNSNGGVSFNPKSIKQLDAFTILFWMNAPSFPTSSSILFLYPNDTIGNSDEWWDVGISSTGPLYFRYRMSADAGVWKITSNPSTGVAHLYGITYNTTSAANDPVFYIDGQSVSSSEFNAPAGSRLTGTASTLYIGKALDPSPALVSTIYNLVIYNRALTVSEFQSAYNSRLAVPSRRGLVFAPNLCKAKSVSVFDGTVLGATNTIVDEVNGYIGTPGGSPVGKGDDLLVHAGEN